MRISLLRSAKRISSILSHPGLVEDILSDSDPENSPERVGEALKVEDTYFLGVVLEKDLVGVIVFDKYETEDSYQIHVNMLPDFRGKIADKALEMAEEWIRKKGALQIVAIIPTLFPNVIRFAVRSGYVVSKILIGSYEKRSQVYNQYLMIKELEN